MFSSLSFKKFGRRIRSPFTFFKKLGKKQRKSKQASKQHKSPIAEHETVATPTLNVKIPDTSNAVAASSDSGVFFPPTPKSLSSEFGPTSRVHAFERALPEIVDEVGLEPSEKAETSNLVLSGKKDVAADKSAEVANNKELPANPIKVSDAEPIENPPVALAKDIEVQSEEQAVITAVTAEPAVGDVADNESTREIAAIEVTGSPLPSQDEAVAKEPEAAPAECAMSEPAPEPVEEPTQVIEQDQVIETDVVPANVDKVAAKEPLATPVDCTVGVDTSIKVEDTSEDTQLVESPVEEKSNQQFRIATTKNDDMQKPVPIHSPPQSPRSVSSPKVLTPPITPRKRATSEGQTKKDQDILDELQTSVRSREKKRKEQERKQTAEKERKLRELSLKVEELEKACSSPDGDEVLRDVRSWRKQRESSLKRSPEDDAKLAAYREAFAREEIMLELQSAVQTRTERGPYTEDPAEKRQQLVLEEIYAQRVPAMQT